MHIIKLDATDSTNLYLKNLMLSEPLEDLSVVITKEQTEGRGQMGTSWQSTKGKNLTFSILKKFDGFLIQNQFHLNMAVSLAIYTMLHAYNTSDLKIKWPNDILSGTGKICGILIENIAKGRQIRASVIGIGLNVNQTDFPNHFNATSLKLLLGKSFNLDELLQSLLEKLIHYFKLLESGKITEVKESYLEVLFMYGEVANFQKPDGQKFAGTINGISENGRLQVLLESNVLKEFGLKEIKLLY